MNTGFAWKMEKFNPEGMFAKPRMHQIKICWWHNELKVAVKEKKSMPRNIYKETLWIGKNMYDIEIEHKQR